MVDRRLTMAVASVVAAAILTGCSGAAPASGDGADVVYTSAKVRTVDPSNPVAEAIAIEDGEITAVGSNDEAMAEAGADTEVVDLDGRAVVPGFFDVHLHAVEAGRLAELCFLPSSRGERFYVRRLRSCARQQRGAPWVRGSGPFVQDLLALRTEPRDLLDRAIPDRPVVINDALGHAVFVNSEGLRVAGIAGRRGDPPGGAVLRGPGGRPNGVLLENAQNIALDAAERPSRWNRRANYEALLRAIDELKANGITSVSDAGGYWPRQHHLAWMRASDAGKLDVRASNALWVYPDRPFARQVRRITEIRDQAARAGLRFDQVKLYVDGIVDYGTAALEDPYRHRPAWAPGGRRGFTYFSRRRLNRYVAAFDRRGFQVQLHVWGDRAARLGLDAIERARRLNGPSERPDRLTHLYLVDKGDRRRFAELGVVADFQLGVEAIDPGYARFLEPWIGRADAHRLLPVASLLDAGAPVTLSSDWDADQLSPLASMERGLTRRGSDEVIPDAATALRMVTLDSARLLGQDAITGSIEVGKRADLVVLDRDPLAIPASEIGEIGVALTVLDGDVVYGGGAIERG